jgi:hypothetical protein
MDEVEASLASSTLTTPIHLSFNLQNFLSFTFIQKSQGQDVSQTLITTGYILFATPSQSVSPLK